jgi:hypothetical protein
MSTPPRLFNDKYERHGNDFYRTPGWVTDCLLNTIRIRGPVWEPCAGQGDIASVLAKRGVVIATDLNSYDDCLFPVASGVDALSARLPSGVRSIVTNPPYRKDLLPQLLERWLAITHAVEGQVCLLLNALWGQTQSGQRQTTLHEAYAGSIRLPRRVRWLNVDQTVTPQHSHVWLVWDWQRNRHQQPYDISAGQGRQCMVCRGSIENLRPNALTCSARCRMALSRRSRSAGSGVVPEVPVPPSSSPGQLYG